MQPISCNSHYYLTNIEKRKLEECVPSSNLIECKIPDISNQSNKKTKQNLENQVNLIGDLPIDIFTEISNYLTLNDSLNLSMTGKSLQKFRNFIFSQNFQTIRKISDKLHVLNFLGQEKLSIRFLDLTTDNQWKVTKKDLIALFAHCPKIEEIRINAFNLAQIKIIKKKLRHFQQLKNLKKSNLFIGHLIGERDTIFLITNYLL